MAKFTDQTNEVALLGVALAAAVSISSAAEDWEPLESIVGMVLIAIIVSYYDYRQLFSTRGERSRRASFAGVIGLCFCLIAAWPLQLRYCDETLNWLLPLVWALITGGILTVGRAPIITAIRHTLNKLRRKGSQPVT